MPIIRYETIQTHSPGCWRWASHWRCAVRLVEEARVLLQDVQDWKELPDWLRKDVGKWLDEVAEEEEL